jgi:hypothetical protein
VNKLLNPIYSLVSAHWIKINRRSVRNVVVKTAHLHDVVFTARNHPTPIRTKFDGINTTGVSFISVDASFSSNVPYFEICVERSRRKELSKGMEIYGYAI